jgi:hypothetical protein
MDHASRARRAAARFLIGPVAALVLAAPVLAGPSEELQEKTEAAKVAKKVKKAEGAAHLAEEEREALRHFQEAVEEYAELHAKQLDKLGPRTATDAKEAAAAQKALSSAIVTKRAKAMPGDVFRPEVQPLFRRLLAEQLKGPDAAAARKAVVEGNPTEEEDSAPVVVRVNAAYPSGATRSTVPPSVLLTLPPLPACLHYRFVGRDLILVDSVAQLIVDFLPAAAPALASK